MQQPDITRLEGENYDRVYLPTLKKVARALGAEIEIKLSAKRAQQRQPVKYLSASPAFVARLFLSINCLMLPARSR